MYTRINKTITMILLLLSPISMLKHYAAGNNKVFFVGFVYTYIPGQIEKATKIVRAVDSSLLTSENNVSSILQSKADQLSPFQNMFYYTGKTWDQNPVSAKTYSCEEITSN